MEFTPEEEQISNEARDYITTHKQELINQFILSKKPLALSLTTIFTAGSPGAGKTEFSR